MNAEQIAEEIRRIEKMTYSETVNNQARIQTLALWQIALQVSMLREAAEESADHERHQ